MPGPRMGDRPRDFDEALVRQAPTFLKWLELKFGENLRYACRDFTKGRGEDEERLMRRIMIARRNNVKDHEILKHARTELQDRIQTTIHSSKAIDVTLSSTTVPKKKHNDTNTNNNNNKMDLSTTTKRKRALLDDGDGPPVMSDVEIMQEMDIAAVEKTPSFQAWKKLMDGVIFTYNQRYMKGQSGHEWLLKKSIWRRMRYRRENKQIVSQLDITQRSAVFNSFTNSYDTNNNNTTTSRHRKESSIKRKGLTKKGNDNDHYEQSSFMEGTQILDEKRLPNSIISKKKLIPDNTLSSFSERKNTVSATVMDSVVATSTPSLHQNTTEKSNHLENAPDNNIVSVSSNSNVLVPLHDENALDYAAQLAAAAASHINLSNISKEEV